MVLQCICGGAVEIDGDKSSYGDDTAYEVYECVACGETGTYTFNGVTEHFSGCVTTDQY